MVIGTLVGPPFVKNTKASPVVDMFKPIDEPSSASVAVTTTSTPSIVPVTTVSLPFVLKTKSVKSTFSTIRRSSLSTMPSLSSSISIESLMLSLSKSFSDRKSASLASVSTFVRIASGSEVIAPS